MAKQRITIDIDTKDKPAYNGIEGDGYRALEDFFVGLGFGVEKIDYGPGAVKADLTEECHFDCGN